MTTVKLTINGKVFEGHDEYTMFERARENMAQLQRDLADAMLFSTHAMPSDPEALWEERPSKFSQDPNIIDGVCWDVEEDKPLLEAGNE